MLKDLTELIPELDFGLYRLEEFQNISLSEDLKNKLRSGFQRKGMEIKFLDNCTVITSRSDDPRIFPNLYYHFAKVLFEEFAEAVKDYGTLLSKAKTEIDRNVFINLQDYQPEIDFSNSTPESIIEILENSGPEGIRDLTGFVIHELPEPEDQKRFLMSLFHPESRIGAKNPFGKKGMRGDFVPSVLAKALPINFNKHGDNLPILISELTEMDVRFSELDNGILYTGIEADLEVGMNKPHNRIIYGAPGTGKSFQLKQDLSGVPEDRIIRVTFNPEMSYGQFVGAYKPVNHADENRIIYDLVPGPLLNALVKAQSGEPVFLIIEEINRANVSAVFGDFFQTLDRDDSGKSTYGIACSPEITLFLTSKGVVLENGDHVILPANLYLWATMNSADQGVFTLDTAFKRRWSFEYIPLNKGSVHINRLDIALSDGVSIKWDIFRNELNRVLKTMKVPEDKLIGPFFLTKKEMESKSGFLGKLSLYLWDDVLRHKNRSAIFKSVTLSELTEISHNHTGELNSLLDKLFEDSLAERLKENQEPATLTEEGAGEEENIQEI